MTIKSTHKVVLTFSHKLSNYVKQIATLYNFIQVTMQYIIKLF